MVLAPAVKTVPDTVTDAVAVPPDPARFASPSELLPTEKLTDPAGVAVPEAAFTVAVTVVEEVTGIVAGFAASVVVVAVMAAFPPQFVTMAFKSTEPRPEATSYPGPAEYPIFPLTQLVEPAAHGIMLEPTVTSWNTLGVLCARL